MIHFNFSETEHKKAGWLLVLLALCFSLALFTATESPHSMNTSSKTEDSCISLSGQEQLQCFQQRNTASPTYNDTVSFERELMLAVQILFVAQLILLFTFKISWQQATAFLSIDGVGAVFASGVFEFFIVLVPLTCVSLGRRYWHLRSLFW